MLYEVDRMESTPEMSHSFIHYLGSTEQNMSTFIVSPVWAYLIHGKPEVLNKVGKKRCALHLDIIQRVFNYQPIQPLAKLAFGIYLSHIIIIGTRLLAIRETYVMTHSGIFEGAIIDYVLAVLTAYMLYILIECPVYHLIKIICGQHVSEVERSGVY
ncbi:unnamed protein product [Medioppia subpectinata]|uniref:Uncharacterized protein n=1 Tax=Medioppia subpectinata TaxID=1979941 RepID=A0A7R9KN93_9ACAR|nr:unnamed protein product [Medioppia subpectinata]CAG2106718.1 unnamed protein product [Medioppia subpectinata]